MPEDGLFSHVCDLFLYKGKSNRVLIELQYGQEGFLWNLNRSDLFHTLLSFFLLLQQLTLTRNITTITLGRYILAYSLDGFTGYDLGSDSGLNGYFKLLTRDQFFQFSHIRRPKVTLLSTCVSVERASTGSPFSRISSLTSLLGR